jgi:hypothetical protein
VRYADCAEERRSFKAFSSVAPSLFSFTICELSCVASTATVRQVLGEDMAMRRGSRMCL